MKTLFLFLSLLACTSVCGQTKKAPVMNSCTGDSKERTVDIEAYSVLDKGTILCHLSNSNEQIFVDMIIVDPAVQKKLLDIGMNMWIDVTGKDKKTIGVRYPVGANSVRKQLSAKGDYLTQDELMMLARNSTVEMANEIGLTGFGEDVPARVPCKGHDGFSASVYYSDDGELLYHLVIPMDRIPFNESKGKLTPFSLGVEYGVPPVMARPRQGADARPAAVVPPAGGGGRGGGRPTGGTRPGGAGMAAPGGQTAQPALWIKGLIPAGK